MRTYYLATLAVVFGAVATPASAQAIRGRVVDAPSGAAIAEARVVALGPDQRPVGQVSTGANGEFELRFRRPVIVKLQAARVGYQAVTSREIAVGPGDTVLVEITISTRAVALDPLTVTGRQGLPRRPEMESTGFYTREARGFGRFYRRDFVEKRMQRPIANILDEVPGVSIHRDRNGTETVIFDRGQSSGAFRRAATGGPDKCDPVVYLDGVRVRVGGGGTAINDLVQASQIEALEVYGSAAQLPVEFNGSDASCGVIVIWTRRGS